jgi:hypothetical protein
VGAAAAGIGMYPHGRKKQLFINETFFFFLIVELFGCLGGGEKCVGVECES